MKLYYITSTRLSHEQAHGIQIMKMCEAFANTGVEVVLVVPRLDIRSGIFKAYSVKENFKIQYIPTLAIPLSFPKAFALLAISFAVAARIWLMMQKDGLVYTRGEMSLFIAPWLPRRFTLVWETHIKPIYPSRYNLVMRRARLIVAITKYYANEIPRVWNISSDKVLYAPDAVDVNAFAGAESKEAARNRLDLPQDKKIVLYAGRVDSWKGIDILLEASQFAPENVQVVIIGGTKEQVLELEVKYPKVRFLGYRPYSELPDNQAAADVLVLSGDPKSEIAQHYTSPLKLFTYMASSVPIIAFDLPAYRDVLSESQAFFCKPNVEALVLAVKEVFENPSDAKSRAAAAATLALEYTWDARAKKLLTALSSATINM